MTGSSEATRGPGGTAAILHPTNTAKSDGFYLKHRPELRWLDLLSHLLQTLLRLKDGVVYPLGPDVQVIKGHLIEPIPLLQAEFSCVNSLKDISNPQTFSEMLLESGFSKHWN